MEGEKKELNRVEMSARVNDARKKTKLYSAIITVSVIGSLFFSIPPVLMQTNTPQSYLRFPFYVLAVFFSYKRYSIGKVLAKLVKENIVCEILAETFELETYLPGGCLPAEQIDESGLLGGCGRCSGSDLVIGKYKGVHVEFCDIAVDHEIKNADGELTYFNVFNGQWLEIALKRQLSSAVYLAERIGSNSIRGSLKMQEVTTDSDAFNKKYQVLAKDPQMAFYVLTPHFMEYVTAADAAADSVTYFCFMGNRARIAMGRKDNERDLFELGDIKKLKKKINLDWLRSKINSDLRYITGTLDELLRNEYLFGGR